MASQAAFGANGSIIHAGRTSNHVGSATDALVVRLVEQGVPFCFGDGSGTACSCNNASTLASGQGCRNSLGTGAKIVDLGDASRSVDTLALSATSTTNVPVLFYQGTLRSNGGLKTVFGDGLQCASGALIRLGTVQASSGTSMYPQPAGNPISVRGFVQAGSTYHYQARYRNVAAFCTSATFNRTNRLSIHWGI